MPKLNVLNIQGQNVGEIELAESIFNVEVNEHVLYEVVKNQLANKRQGTQSAKTRAEVRGGGRKPWRQKGTGRARAGMSSSPVWRGGGRAFPNTPDENFTQKINKKMMRGAMACILSKLAIDGRLVVVENIDVDTPKTKNFANKLKAMGLNSALIITDEISENLDLASRNLKNVWVVEPRYADPVSLVHFDSVVVTKAAISKLEEMWG